MSQSFYSLFFFGFPLHTFSLIKPIFSLSTHNLPIKQTTKVYTINVFPLNPNCFQFSNQSLSLSLSLSLTYYLLIKKRAFLPNKTFNCLPLDLKPIDLVFYIDFESLFKVTKLQLELESLFEVGFSSSSLELLCFSVAIFMVFCLYCFLFTP